jgi:hypothetical protein
MSEEAIFPKFMNVLDQHGGFIAVTTKHGDTLWRPGQVLKKGTTGRLVEGSVEPFTFFQQNNNVRSALYKTPGYRYPIKVWIDNTTNKRVA